MTDLVALLSEVFTWVGFGAGVILLVATLIARIADGTWLPARGAVDLTPDGAVVRWFDEDGNVNEAALSDHDARSTGGADMIDIWYRRGWIGRMRLHPRSRSVGGLLGLAALLLGVGIIATVVQFVALAVER